MMYIDTILHHHIRRCPYNIISIMLISTTQLPRGWWALFWNRSLYFIRILYIAAAMKNHMVEDGWPAVDRLYSNWGYAWDCMRIDNSTITEIIVMLLFGKRCLCYFNHIILLFLVNSVSSHIHNYYCNIHQQIMCTSFRISMDQLFDWLYNKYPGHESTINTYTTNWNISIGITGTGGMQYNIRSDSITWGLIVCIR